MSAANQTPAPVGLSALLDSPFQVEPGLGTSRLPAPPASLVGALLEGVARLEAWWLDDVVGALCVQVFLKQFSCLWFFRVPQCFQVCPGSGMERWMNAMEFMDNIKLEQI